MGSERASIVRGRAAGKICWKCQGEIKGPATWTERMCPKCYKNQPRHRILATFFLRYGWTVSFLEADCKTPVGRIMTFADPDKIIDLAKRGDVTFDEATRKQLEYGLSVGRGTVWLFLTPEQYLRLRGR